MDARISSLNGGTLPVQEEISWRETITRTSELEVPAKISRITIMRCGNDTGRTGGQDRKDRRTVRGKGKSCFSSVHYLVTHGERLRS